MNYDEHLEWLYDLQWHGMKLGLANTEALLAELQNPHEGLKIIHVAGTNGKGSVCAILTSVLVKAGYKVGTYTSPHLSDFTERIAVNGIPVSEGDIVSSIKRIKPKIEKLANRDDEIKCTFFEATTAMAFDIFSRKKVDIAIMEVGMGGRLDSTNVADPIISVITNIGLDHTQHLGDSIRDIAFEKAGIIKKNRPVICGARQADAIDIIQKKAKKMGAGLTLVHDDYRALRIESDIFGSDIDIKTPNGILKDIQIPLAGKHQIGNAMIAIAAIDKLVELGYEIDQDVLHKGIEATRWRGRLQVARTSPLVILDGTHNPPGAEALKDFVLEELADKKIIGIIGMLEDKDAKGFVEKVEHLFDEIVITAPDYHRAMLAEELAEFISMNSNIEKKMASALDRALAMTEDDDYGNSVILITGSIFTASDALAHLDQLRIDIIFHELKKAYPIGAFPGLEVGGNETYKPGREIDDETGHETTLGKRSGDAYNVLISTILSQRTRDQNTHIASENLFAVYDTPEKLANADPNEVERLIKPAGFYVQKTKKIMDTARILVEKYDSQVPEDIDELLDLPGVGRKTANCVLVYGFERPAIAVDTHVHRISNLMGLVRSQVPDDTEISLERILPKEYWIDINRLLVRHGQEICKPINPQCGKCFLSHICDTGIYRLSTLRSG